MTDRVDVPRRSPEAVLARLGIASDTAVPALTRLGVWSPSGPAPRAWEIAGALSDGADPDRALTALCRVHERDPAAAEEVLGDAAWLGRFAAVAGASDALAALLVSEPRILRALAGSLPPWTAADVYEHARRALGEEGDDVASLAVLQREGITRIAARDLCGLADTPQATVELTALAEGILAAALDAVRGDVPVALVAMGKLGGRELNYVSDVDVLFVHGGEVETRTGGDHAAAQRVCERFLRLLASPTPYGLTYEVDANLRPEGRDGPLSRTLESYRAYYERWAEPWEFQALLKARPIGGDGVTGAAFVELISPFVWPDRLTADAVAQIQRMKGVVETSREVRRVGRRQVKLAPGGLRDIEFAVQLLQLVHGRHDAGLRSPNTLAALDALAAGGYVDDADAAVFADAYRFLRTLEHRLQLVRLRRTHTLPEGEEDRARLARAMGFRNETDVTALAQLDAEIRRVQAAVRRIHEQLFYRPLLARFAEVGRDELVPLRVADGTAEPELGEEAARERLAALGFADAAGALRSIEALAVGVTRRARLFRTLLPALLPTIAASPDPDAGLRQLRSLAERLGDSATLLATLRDHPPVAELLAVVLGASRVVGEWLQRQPEVIADLVDADESRHEQVADEYRRLAGGLLRRGQHGGDATAALRRLRRREMARIAVRDLAGLADQREVGEELSELAAACLEAAVGLATQHGPRFAVVGLGKLGGRELSYASDLDCLLVFDPADRYEDAVRSAEVLLRLLSDITPEGQAFAVDLQLRPEGKDGPLARTVESYRSYYERWGEAWEMQALTQARVVAGDRALGAALLDAVTPLVYPETPPRGRLQAVRLMKARIERERAARPPGPGARRLAQRRPARPSHVDLKLGPGGLADIEWTVQLLQLAHGGARPSLRRTGARAGVEALRREGLLSPEEADWLHDGWALLTRLRNACYLAGMRSSDRLPSAADDQERLARMLGYPRPGGQALLEDVGRVMRRVRKVHERRFYDD